jgi:hypothetical protein
MRDRSRHCARLALSALLAATLDVVLPARATAQTEPGAVVVERRPLAAAGYPARALVLWMKRPTRHPTAYAPDDVYTCPDATRGSYYSGPTRVSLVDAASGRVVNTVEVRDPDGEGDSFDVPYLIRPGYYRTASPAKTRESKPTLMWLRDYNGDGKALEFALFEAPACMGLQTALVGYDPESDRVVQYPVRLEITSEGRTTTETWTWVDYLFSREPDAPGRWRYEIDYRGRGGSLDAFAVRYDAATKRFLGTLVRTAGE